MTDRLHVLLVEDDQGDVFLIQEFLDEVNAPIDLEVVATVAAARAALGHGVDCILLDLELSDAWGLAALHELTTAGAGVPICVLTGLADEHMGIAAMAEGAQDYLIKGRIDGGVLARAIRYAVERRRAEEGAQRLRDARRHQEESTRLERGLLPQPLIDTSAIVLYSFYRPGRARALLGGDFYDAVQTAADRVSLLVGDVSGHGPGAAALGAELRVAWRALILAGVDDLDLLRALDRVMVSERPSGEIFATLAMVHVDLGQRVAHVRSVGHPPPLLITAFDVEEVPVTPSMIMGLSPDHPPTGTPADVTLPERDWAILAYTDGLVEGRDGDERLGSDGLRALVTAYRRAGFGLDLLPSMLVAEAERRNGGPLEDDVAMLLLTVPGQAVATTLPGATAEPIPVPAAGGAT